MGLGTVELLIILAILFFILGGRKIPEISRGFGLAARNFKKGLREPDAVDVTPMKEEPPRRKDLFRGKNRGNGAVSKNT